MMKHNNNGMIALSYAKRGWGVFPLHFVHSEKCRCMSPNCASPGKHPIAKYAPNGVKDATTDETKVIEWWGDCPPANIGVATGKKSGIFVLDVDYKNGGKESVKKIIAEHGEPGITATAITGNGCHYYYKYPTDGSVIKCSTNIGGYAGLDIRGDNGYVVAPYSSHISGNQYHWHKDRSYSKVEIAEAPEWLLDIARNPRKKSTIQEDGGKASPPSSASFQKQHNWIAEDLKNLKEGNRNDTFAKIIGRLHRDGHENDVILEMLKPHAEKVSFPVYELETEIAGICSRYESLAPRKRAIVTVPLTDLLKEPDEDEKWIVDQLIPEGGLALLAAKPKVGKSTLARYMAAQISEGLDCLGRKSTKGAVIYLAFEESRRGVKSHYRNMGIEKADNIHFFIDAAPNEAAAQIESLACDKRPQLIIIDTMAHVFPGRNINEYLEMMNALGCLREVIRRSGAAMLLLHHARKGSGEGGIDAILGSTAIAASVDTIIQLDKRRDGQRSISTTQRYGDACDGHVISFDKERGIFKLAESLSELRRRDIKFEILDILASKSEPVIGEVVYQELQCDRGQKIEAFKELLAENKILRTGAGKKGDPYLYESIENSGCQSPTLDVKLETGKDKQKKNGTPHLCRGFDNPEDGKEAL